MKISVQWLKSCKTEKDKFYYQLLVFHFREWERHEASWRHRICKDILYIYIYVKVKWSRYRLGLAQRVGRGIALLFHDRGTRRGWVVSSTPRPHFTPGKDPVPILQEAGWAPGPVWTSRKSRPPPGFDSGPSSPQSVTIPTDLPGPQLIQICNK